MADLDSLRTWETDQVVILDWMDEPREGFIRSSSGDCFHFKLFASSCSVGEPGDNLYALRPVESAAFQRILAALSCLGDPIRPSWIPLWRFPDQEQRLRAEMIVDSAISSAGEIDMLLQSQDLLTIRHVWRRSAVR